MSKSLPCRAGRRVQYNGIDYTKTIPGSTSVCKKKVASKKHIIYIYVIRGACKNDSHFFLTLSFLFLTLLILKKRGRKKMKMFSGRRRRCSQISSFKMLKLRGRKKKNKVMMMMMMNTSPTQPPTSNPSPNPQPKASRQLVERQVLAITAFSDETCYH